MSLGVAVKVRLVPVQMVLSVSLDLMVTEGVKVGLTAVVITLELAVGCVRHVPPVMVISQLTLSPLARVDVVKVFWLEPTTEPFSFHE